MASGNFFEDLTRRTASDNILHDKTFNTAKNPKYNGHQRGLASIVYKFFDKKSTLLTDKSASGSGIRNKSMSNKELSEKLHKPIIQKFIKRTVHSSFIDNIWGIDIAICNWKVNLVEEFVF